MTKQKIISALVLIGIMALSSIPTAGQTGQTKRGWGAVRRSATDSARAKTDESNTDAQTPALSSQLKASDTKPTLVGTWVVNIPASPGSAEFNALQTYHEDGTIVETSDLLATLAEGPAHGVWRGKKRDYSFTFELFAFDPDHNPVGRIRVRGTIKLIEDDSFMGDTAVDFIEPDGNVILNIGGGPFTGKRMTVQPL